MFLRSPVTTHGGNYGILRAVGEAAAGSAEAPVGNIPGARQPLSETQKRVVGPADAFCWELKSGLNV